ncbi:MAG: acyl-CoA dehydrogenase family protein [Candidatus Dormibacteraeota bacterium]|nr:acyl-CoA dehydrogenase family protein [Candidatus Dormibacteraeota bacterium]
MTWTLTDEQLMIRETVREAAQAKIAPRSKEVDETAEFPQDYVDLIRDLGLFAIPFKPEYGGLSGSALTLAVAVEELSKVDATAGLILAVQALSGYPFNIAGTEEQKQKWIPPLASGEKLSAYALTEPGSGSDAAAMKTRAIKKGDRYIVNGSKIFITHGNVADVIVIFAVTDPSQGSRGTTAFVIERDYPGFSSTPIKEKLGIRGSDTAELAFEDMEVPEENRLGPEGDGFKIALKVLDRSRPGVGAQALGIAAGAVDYAIQYAKQREQFGHPIADFQGIQWMLADMATQVEAARNLVYQASAMIDEGDPQVTKFAAMAKMFASDTAMRVTTDAVQILGGYGYIKEYPVERMMRDAKITQIYEGTNQIQRVVIARHLLK